MTPEPQSPQASPATPSEEFAGESAPPAAPRSLERLRGALKVETAAPETSFTSLEGYYGVVFPSGMDDLRKGPWVEAVAGLSRGLDVTMECYEGTTRRRQLAKAHRLRLHPDGTITMLDHTDYTPDGTGHSTSLHLPTEAFLSTLSDLPGCVLNTLWMTLAISDPKGSATQQQTLFPHGPDPYYWAARVRAVHAAIQWAQPGPDGAHRWPAGAIEKFVRHAITPQALAHWNDYGWAPHEALLFQQNHVAFALAEKWRAHGETTLRAARLAGRGFGPEHDQEWLDVGFTHETAQRWRIFRTYRQPHPTTAFTPEESWHWHQHGVPPSVVDDFKCLPTTYNPNSVKPAHYLRRTPTQAEALAWAKAGVPAQEVLPWWRTTEADLSTVLEWSRHLPARHFPPIAEWNKAHPDTPIESEMVQKAHRIGVPYDAETLGVIAQHALTTHQILRPLDMVPASRRWLGIEARLVLTDIITNRFTHQPARERMLKEIADGAWTSILRGMRTPWMNSHAGLWKPYLEWVATCPAPPQTKHSHRG